MGLDSEQFVDLDDIVQDLFCPLCTEILSNPVQTPCGHTFCEQCILRWFLQQQTCPVDRSQVTSKELKPDVAAAHSIEQLTVRCHNELHGCLFRGPRSSLADHLRECQFAVVACHHTECKVQVCRRDLEDHLARCRFQRVECKCGQTVALFEYQPHIDEECPRTNVECPNGCGTSVPRGELVQHRAQCPDETVGCAHKEVGCGWVGLRAVRDQHVAACPYEGLKGFLYRTVDDMQALRQEVRQLKVQVHILNKWVPSLNRPGQAQPGRNSQLEQERLEHMSFAESRARVYISRPEAFHKLDEHALSQMGPPLLVTGESGIGKSSLLANWAFDFESRHSDFLVICHFIGSTSESACFHNILRRITAEIREFLEPGEAAPPPNDSQEQRAPVCSGSWAFLPASTRDQTQTQSQLTHMLEFWLQRLANEKRRAVILLDGLDQLEDRENALDLHWLPFSFPPNVRLVVSSLPGRCVDVIRSRSWDVVPVPPLQDSERRLIIAEYTQRYNKQLSPEQTAQIVAADQTAIPLFLRTFLNELLGHPDPTQSLDQRIRHYLEAGSVLELYQEYVLLRWERDFGSELAGEFMSLVWASFQGLSEAELVSLLNVTRQALLPLLRALQDFMVVRGSGLMIFFHAHLKQAIQRRYLAAESTRREYHLKLARFFESQPYSARHVAEVPHHYEQCEQWERLQACISDLDMFTKLYTSDRKVDLFRYWRVCADYGAAAQHYNTKIAEFQQTSNNKEHLAYLVEQVALFLKDVGQYHHSCEAFLKVLEIRESIYGGSHILIARSLINYGTILGVLFRKRSPMFKRAIEIIEQEHGKDHFDLAKPLQELATIWKNQKKWSAAVTDMKRALLITEKHADQHPEDFVQVLIGFGDIYREWARYSDSLVYYKQALHLAETRVGPRSVYVGTCLNNIGLSYQYMGLLDDAEPFYRRALRLTVETVGYDHPQMATRLHNLAWLEHYRCNYDKALEGYWQSMKIKEQVFGKHHKKLLVGLENIVDVLKKMERWEEARVVQERHASIKENYRDDR